jgi:hypothetical protein
MTKTNLRNVSVRSTVLACIEGGYAELESLQQECQEIVDNATEGLSQTQRIQTLEETASALYNADSPPDVPEFLQDVEVTYTEDQRKSKSHSRATRCSEACATLSAAIEGIQNWLDTNEDSEDRDEAEQLLSDIQELADNAEGCEFPGMFG